MDANEHFERAISYVTEEDYENALEYFGEAIRLDPNNAKFYYRRASTYLTMNKWAEAISDYSEALRLKPDPKDRDMWNFTVDELYEHRGICYRYQGNYVAAIADANELIRLQPNNPRHYMNRSVFYKLNGDFEKALEDIHTTNRLNPDAFLYLTLTADVYRRQGDKQAYMSALNELIQQFGDANSYFDRGQLWQEQNDFVKAIADFEKAIELAPELDEIYFALAEVYELNGNFDEALNIINAIVHRKTAYEQRAL